MGGDSSCQWSMISNDEWKLAKGVVATIAIEVVLVVVAIVDGFGIQKLWKLDFIIIIIGYDF